VLKRDITYENFDGEKVTEAFYFNLTKTELLEMQIDYEGGMEALINRIIRTDDIKSLVGLFKKIVLAAYGVRSDDGKRFIKNDVLREEFTQTAAYDSLFMELTTDEGAAATFVIGIVPQAMKEEIEKAELVKPQSNDVPLPLEDVSATQTSTE
jgi:hypothetical protein